MADETIPQPVAPPNTDVQPGQASGPPPVPAGFSDAPPSAPPTPAGFSDNQPAESAQPDENMGASPEQQMAMGAGKGLMSTVEGLGKLIHKIPVVGEKLVELFGSKLSRRLR